MKEITSKSNNLLKTVSKLSDKKYRDELGVFLIEGYNNVVDTLTAAHPNDVEHILIDNNFSDKYIPLFESYQDKISLVKHEIFDTLSDMEAKRGVMLIAKKRKVKMSVSERLCIFLDRIRDPGNIGTIIRTAVAAGFGIILNNCADIYSPKVVRSGVSAIYKADICYGDTSYLDTLKNDGYRVLGADMSGENIFAHTFKLDAAQKICVVVGNEADGLSADARSLCDKLISIPMEKMESLNAAVASGIIMYRLKYAI